MNILPIRYAAGEREAYRGEGYFDQCVATYSFLSCGMTGKLLNKYYRTDLEQSNVLLQACFDDNSWNYYMIPDMILLLNELEDIIHDPDYTADKRMDIYTEFLQCMREMLAHADGCDCILFEGP